MSKFTTINGKDVATFICPKTSYHRIKFIPGGELPVCLTGVFTSEALADRAIFEYIAKATPQAGDKDQPKVKTKA